MSKTVEERLEIIEKALKKLADWIEAQHRITQSDSMLFDNIKANLDDINERLKILEGKQNE